MIKYNHLQFIYNQYTIIYNPQQLNTTIYNHLQPFTIYLQVIYNQL